MRKPWFFPVIKDLPWNKSKLQFCGAENTRKQWTGHCARATWVGSTKQAREDKEHKSRSKIAQKKVPSWETCKCFIRLWLGCHQKRARHQGRHQAEPWEGRVHCAQVGGGFYATGHCWGILSEGNTTARFAFQKYPFLAVLRVEEVDEGGIRRLLRHSDWDTMSMRPTRRRHGWKDLVLFSECQGCSALLSDRNLTALSRRALSLSMIAACIAL